MTLDQPPFKVVRLCLTHWAIVSNYRNSWCRYSGSGDDDACDVRPFALLPLED
jgi:hypothetical protein